MKKELLEKLYEKYPKIFARKDNSKNKYWVSCGDGWYDILDVLCEQAQYSFEPFTGKFEVTQIKEKFGGLRFYYDLRVDDNELSVERLTSEIYGLVRMAEAISNRVCEECGLHGYKNKEGWVKTFCDSCHEIRREKYKKV